MRRSTLAQALAAGVALARLSRGRKRRGPLAAEGLPAPPRVSAVIPARNEEKRIAPALRALREDPDVAEVVVVDDASSDATAAVAAGLGARVVAGDPLPDGWVGKAWALQQGIEQARGEIVVCLDADTVPVPGLARALAGRLDAGADLLTAGARFVCDTRLERLLHPALLATLVYRFGPAGAPGGRLLANGQCLAARRAPLLAAGGLGRVRHHMTEDVALARSLARAGWTVAFEDATRLLDVRMHASGAETWREWGRSLALADVEPPAWLLADLAVVWLVLALPVLRLAARRATPLDGALLAVRAALLAALAPAYARRGAAFWLSPLADPAAALRLTLSALRPARSWRGRTYARGGSAARRAS